MKKKNLNQRRQGILEHVVIWVPESTYSRLARNAKKAKLDIPQYIDSLVRK